MHTETPSTGGDGTDRPDAYVVTGRALYTMNPARPRVEGLAVVGGRIAAAGTLDEVEAALPRRPGKVARIDLGRRMLLPGFTDSHNHFAYLARKWRAVDLAGCATMEEALERVAAYAAARPEREWIDGHGWDANVWGRRPQREALDRIVPDRPVALSSKDGHGLWVNTKALERAGLVGGDGPSGTPTFVESLVPRRPEDGQPTGIVYETAVKFVLAALPPPTIAEGAAALREGVAELHAQGITAVHCPEQPEDWRVYRRLHRTGDLGVRVTYWLPVDRLDEAISLGLETGFGDRWLRLGPVKIFADGTLGQRTAALLAPYEGEPDNVGIALYGRKELFRLMRRAASHGWAVAVHAIGDRAVRDALDGFAACLEQGGPDTAPERGRARHRIEHAQLVHPEDAPRFGALGVVASMQPLHAPADAVNAERYWGDRSRWAFPFRTLLDAGATLAFGSDAPFGLDLTADSFSVLAGVDAAVHRRGPDGQPWRPAQSLTVFEAVRAFTSDAAYAGGEEGWRGALIPGHVADMVVLSEDVFAAPESIGRARVEATVVDGRPVYGELF